MDGCTGGWVDGWIFFLIYFLGGRSEGVGRWGKWMGGKGTGGWMGE